jgi:hypothetical protein
MVLCALISSSAEAGLAVSQWVLFSGVDDFSIHGETHRSFFTSVQNPFQVTQSVQFENSFVNTGYDFSWQGDSGTFGVVSSQQISQLYGEVGANGPCS